MDLAPTVIAAAVCFAFAAFCGWRGARLPNPMKGPRLIPWRPLMVMAATLGMLLVIHVATLFGLIKGP